MAKLTTIYNPTNPTRTLLSQKSFDTNSLEEVESISIAPLIQSSVGPQVVSGTYVTIPDSVLSEPVIEYKTIEVVVEKIVEKIVEVPTIVEKVVERVVEVVKEVPVEVKVVEIKEVVSVQVVDKLVHKIPSWVFGVMGAETLIIIVLLIKG